MIRFVLNNEVVSTEAKTGMPLLHFIRGKMGLKGTKSGCKEGDCGACTVLVGTLINGQVEYESITACLSPLGSVHGKHVVTVEGLNLKHKLNKIQDSLRENHGTQCGFCTPGFIVSFTGYALNNGKGETEFRDSLSGNICRCTGYKSIERAGSQLKALLALTNSKVSLNWLVSESFIPSYFLKIPELLKTIDKSHELTDCNLVGGGTDLYVKEADNLLDKEVCLTNDRISRHILIEDNFCDIGLGSTVSDLWNSEILKHAFPNFKDHLRLVSSEQIRNMATIGGNFVNASPIADLAIYFLALNASLLIENRMGSTRRIALNDFFKSYKVINMAEDEVLQSLRFKVPAGKPYFNFEKVSKRTHLDIASVNTAICIEVKDQNILTCNISIGGVAPIPLFLKKTSSFLKGKLLSIKNVEAAQIILQEEISPISDIRGTVRYKRLLARQLFYAHFIELFPSTFSIQDFKR